MLKLFIILGLVSNIISYLYFSYSLIILFINLILLSLIYSFKEVLLKEKEETLQNNLITNSDKSLINKDLQDFFINHLRDIIIIVNKFNIITFANSSALNFFGNKIIAQNIGSELRQPELLDAIDQSRHDKEIKKIELELKIPTYKYLKVDVIFTEQDNIIIIMKDYSEIKKAQELRSDFVANVSHELKTPLASIKGFLETIQTFAKDDVQTQKKFIKIMQKQANKMQNLIDDLLMLNRIEQQEHIRPTGKVNITKVLKENINNFSEDSQQKKINIKFINSEQNYFVNADKEKLFILFNNILDNALKYSLANKNKEITIKIASKNQKIFVSIKDQGIGIPKNEILRITERFYRSENAKRLKINGTGIGLSIVKHIINQHGGDLRILSSEDKGSEFIVELQEFSLSQDY